MKVGLRCSWQRKGSVTFQDLLLELVANATYTARQDVLRTAGQYEPIISTVLRMNAINAIAAWTRRGMFHLLVACGATSGGGGVGLTW
jgi:hypothetical protein